MPEFDESTEAARSRVASAADSALASGIVPEDPHRLPPPSAWFAPDAERHLLDKPKFCPMCAASIHDRVTVREAGLSKLLTYDAWERRTGLVRFLGADATPESVARGEATEFGDFVGGAYEVASLTGASSPSPPSRHRPWA